MSNKGTTLIDRLIETLDTVVDGVNTKVGINTDAVGTTTVFARLKQIYEAVTKLLDAGELFSKSGPVNIEIDDVGVYSLELYDIGGDVPTTGEITPGNYQIDRIRNGATTNIVASIAASESTGRIYCLETFDVASGWAVGDLILVTFSGGSIVISGGETTVLPNAYFYTRIVRGEVLDTKIGTNVDAAGTTTLFARLKQIVDNYLEKGLLNGTGTVLPSNKSIYDELGGVDSNSYPIASDTKFINKVALTGEVAYSVGDILKISATEKVKNFIAKTGGTEIPLSKSLYDFLLTSDTAGTHDITTANDTVETTVVEITDIIRYGLSMYFDLNALDVAVEGGTVTVRMYNKIDESIYREVGKATFIVGSTTTHPNFEVMRINHNTKFTIECSTDVTVTRQINYRYVKEPKE